MSLSDKSDAEIRDLLIQFGIKHGPILGSTRGVYERRLEKAMAESAVTPSSDFTHYREEEDVITCITYRSPKRRKYTVKPANSEKLLDSPKPTKTIQKLLDKMKDLGGKAASMADSFRKQRSEALARRLPLFKRAANHSAASFKLPISWRRAAGRNKMAVTVLLLAALSVFCYAVLAVAR